MTSVLHRSLLRLLAGAACLTASGGEALAQPPAATGGAGTIEQLRCELAALQQEYEERLAVLEARLAALEATDSIAEAGVRPSDGTAGPGRSLPLYGTAATASKVFNPDIAVIGDFLGAGGTTPLDRSPAFELHEAEASFQAIVDPYARADMFLAFGPDGVEVEEGFITFPALPGGLLVKAGKLRSAFGKVNTLHNHVLPWADRPLVTRNLVGAEEGISDAGFLIDSESDALKERGFEFQGFAAGELARRQDRFVIRERLDHISDSRGY